MFEIKVIDEGMLSRAGQICVGNGPKNVQKYAVQIAKYEI